MVLVYGFSLSKLIIQIRNLNKRLKTFLYKFNIIKMKNFKKYYIRSECGKLYIIFCRNIDNLDVVVDKNIYFANMLSFAKLIPVTLTH